jgi:K+-sensing histidine kinase KdpD
VTGWRAARSTRRPKLRRRRAPGSRPGTCRRCVSWPCYGLASTLASDRRWHRPGGYEPGSGPARERVVVALSGGSDGDVLIRRAARIAARCGGDLLAVHATRSGGPAGPGRGVLAAQRQLIESLGGTYHQLADADIPAALLAFAHAEHATQLMLGAPRHTWRAALQPMTTIVSRVIREGDGIGVHIVTCTPSLEPSGHRLLPPPLLKIISGTDHPG